MGFVGAFGVGFSLELDWLRPRIGLQSALWKVFGMDLVGAFRFGFSLELVGLQPRIGWAPS